MICFKMRDFMLTYTRRPTLYVLAYLTVYGLGVLCLSTTYAYLYLDLASNAHNFSFLIGASVSILVYGWQMSFYTQLICSSPDLSYVQVFGHALYYTFQVSPIQALLTAFFWALTLFTAWTILSTLVRIVYDKRQSFIIRYEAYCNVAFLVTLLIVWIFRGPTPAQGGWSLFLGSYVPFAPYTVPTIATVSKNELILHSDIVGILFFIFCFVVFMACSPS